MNRQNASESTGEQIAAGAQAGQVLVVPSSARVVLGFDVDAASATRDGNDLVFLFDNGGKTVVEKFFVTGEEALPAFVLQSGDVVPGAALLSALNSDLDLTTAAGPSVSAAGGGTADYSDNAGTLLGGLERLGALAADMGSVGTSAINGVPIGLSDFGPSTRLSVPTPPAGPDGPPDGPPENPTGPFSYDGRAVLYTKNDSLSPPPDAITFTGLHVTQYEWVVSEYAAYFSVTLVNGQLTLTLTKEGRDALSGSNSNLYTYLKINGGEHTVQVVLDKDNAFNSGTENTNTESNGIFSGSSSSLGEWHNGDWLYQGNIVTTDKGDVITATHLNTGTLNTAGGDDLISLTGNVSSSRLFAGAGHDTIEIGGSVTESNITLGSGNNLLDVHGKFTGNRVDGGEGDDMLLIGGNAERSTIYTYGGDDFVKIDGDVTNSQLYQEMRISTGAGADTVHVSGSFKQGIIDTGDGHDWIILGGKEMSAVLDGGSGNDTLLLHLNDINAFASKFDLSNVKNVENLWISLENGHTDVIDDTFLRKAVATLQGADVFILRDQADTLQLTPQWEQGGFVTRLDHNGTQVQFAEYTNAETHAKVYLEVLNTVGG